MDTPKIETSFFQTKGFMLLVGFFLFILTITFLFGEHGVLQLAKSRRRLSELKETIGRLEKERDALARQVRQLRDDPLTLERHAREKLWLMKPDETVVVIVKK